MTSAKSILTYVFAALMLATLLFLCIGCIGQLAYRDALAPMYAVLGAMGVFVNFIPTKKSGDRHLVEYFLLQGATALAIILSGLFWLFTSTSVMEHLWVWAVGILAALLSIVAVGTAACGYARKTKGGS